MTGSFCTFSRAEEALEEIKGEGAKILPIFSFHACSMDTRFGRAEEHKQIVEEIAEYESIVTIEQAEPVGPKNLVDILLIAPCTGNTLAKLANGITDTPVTMAVKSHLRNGKPVVICLATNDGLGMNLKNIGLLLNTKHIYFVPFSQDDSVKKPNSLVAKFELIVPTLEKALEEHQIEPLLR